MREIKDCGKISIIVPVYNVEDYIERCVDSIMGQTYSNLEIILIDDGSKDRSGEKCDYFAKKDKRIKVIHKKNEGQSVARNVGIETATGDFLGFVDSDDFLDKKMYETLMKMHKETGCELCACRLYERFVNGQKVENPVNSLATSKKVDFKDSWKDDIGNCLNDSLCNKIFARRIFKDLKFPEGQIYEDSIVFNKIYSEIGEVAVTDYVGYYYCVNPNSTTRKEQVERNYKEIDVIKEREIIFCNKGYDELVKKLQSRIFRRALYLYYVAYKSNDSRYKMFLKGDIEEYYFKLKGTKYIRGKLLLLYLLFKINPKLYCICCKIYYR